jgi:uncharacterized protein YegL
MPKLNDGLNNHKIVNGSYGYSAVGIDNLGATEYTLVVIAVDVSGSVSSYTKAMESSIKSIINACKSSPRADNLLIRLVTFNSTIEEIHGFKLLENCNVKDYDNVLHTFGGTALFDSVENAITSCSDYGKQLSDSDFSANAIVFIITDGCDNQSTASKANVKKAIKDAMNKESLESIVSVLIGVGIGDYLEVEQNLNDFKTESELNEFIKISDATEKSLQKLAKFVSKSISAQSQSLGTGVSASVPPIDLTF